MSRISSTSPGTSNTSWTHSRTASRTIGNDRVLAGDLEQLGRPLALLPQRLAAVGPSAGEQQGAGRALAEAGGEQGRAADLLGDDAAHVVGVEGDQVEQLAADAALAHAVDLVELEVGQAQHDAVVAVHRLHVDAEPVAHPGARRPAPTGRAPGRRRASGWRPASRRARRGTARRRWCGRRARGRWPRAARAGRSRRLSAAHSSRPAAMTRSRAASGLSASTSRTNAPTARPSSAGRPSESPFQNGQPPGQARCGGDQDAVVGDVLDAPGARAEGEQVADARLVDHLLVELADPTARPLAGGEEHGVEPTVGDGAARGDGEALGAAAAGEGVGEAVPRDAGAQLGELLAGVAAREHVEHRVEHGPGEGGVGGRRGGPARARRRRSTRRGRTWRRPAGRARRAGWRAGAAPRSGRRASARRRRRSARGRRGTWGRARRG